MQESCCGGAKFPADFGKFNLQAHWIEKNSIAFCQKVQSMFRSFVAPTWVIQVI
jgi:hypothetical protein